MNVDTDIADLNLECVSYKVLRDEGWSLDRVERVEREYRAFLQIIRDGQGRDDIGPTKEIDTMWHHHILDTEKYARDSGALFGFFLHHYPYSGIFGEADAAAQSERVRKVVVMVENKLGKRGEIA